jgi:RNA polymerase sigma factor (sigma-70 family)
MQELDDITLLRKYADDQSEEAFATLVKRHINKVYSVALRHTGNPSQAEEITQAVFVILAQKSASLTAGWRRRLGAVTRLTGGDGVMAGSLSGWLYQTARLTAATFIRSAIRRARREQEAHMESVLNEAEKDVWKQIAPLLDAAMAGLNETDRHAVVLRFFDGKSMGEIGAALGATEDAAKKRVGRALEKLQTYFAKRGIESTTDTIAQAITGNSIQTAPALLVKSVTAIALTKGAVAGGSTLTLVKATLIAMKTKAIITTVAVAVIVAGIAAWFSGFHFFGQPKKAAPDFAAAGVTFPIQLPNAASKRDRNDPLFEIGLDPDTRRISNSAPAIHIKGPLPPPPGLPPNFSDAALQKAGESSSAPYVITNDSPLMGQHIRITGWLRCSKVQNWAAAYFGIYNPENHRFMRFDTMDDRDDRPILHGTMDWQQVEFITDVPEEPCVLYVGPDLYGPGELWGDDFQITLAPADLPNTDDRRWRHTSAEPNTYSQTTDFQTRHGGHSTVCLAYTGSGAAPSGSWEWWGQKLRGKDVDKYAGHTVQWSGWIKTENVSSRFYPTIRPFSFNPNAGPSMSGKDKLGANSNLKGTHDWTRFSITCAIPDDINHIDTAFLLYGSGKAWIDMDSLKFKIVK